MTSVLAFGPASSVAETLLTSRWGVGGSGPTTVLLAKPCRRQLGGELVEIDDVIKASPAADTQMPAGSVQVVEQQRRQVIVGQGVDGDECDDELAPDVVDLAQDPLEPVRGERYWERNRLGNRDAACGVAKELSFASQSPEQRAKRRMDGVPTVARQVQDRGFDVLSGDLSQVGCPGGGPSPQDRDRVLDIDVDRPGGESGIGSTARSGPVPQAR
ncbi:MULTISPECIES: hypothetical protein [unclassified Streptomyces]|uniref:hypothetical protein n=1 Tax=unclassified Streptomyces TaxID=2593676 RepID=UPI002E180AFF|nr:MULTISPECIES: hypothetical protein [unclassified Streptomyces]